MFVYIIPVNTDVYENEHRVGKPRPSTPLTPIPTPVTPVAKPTTFFREKALTMSISIKPNDKIRIVVKKP